MSFGLSAAAVGLIGIGTGVVGAALSSSATRKQADIQADAIREGGQINAAARARAISQVMEIFGPSLVQFNESMQSSIDLFNQGRASTGDLLTQSANNVSQIAQQGGQNALNAMLGLPSPETASTAPQATSAQQQPTQQLVSQQQAQLPTDQIQPQQPGGINQVGPTQGIPTAPGNQLAEAVLPGGQPTIGFPSDTTGRNDAMESAAEARLTMEQIGQSIANDPFNVNRPATTDASAFQPQIPLEGEFIPRVSDFDQQQAISIPQGTGAGLFGAEEAIRTGADLGRQDLARSATGALESLGTQFGAARTDIGQGRDFALNQIQQAIQAGQGGINRGVGAIQQGVNRGIGFLDPFISAGREALDPLLALSGVRGGEAFDAARVNDPAFQLALQESERSLARQAAVTGGIGSGNVKGRFQLNAQQQAAADIDRQLSRMRAITGAGQQAAGQAGGFATQGGFQQGQLEARGGELESSLLSRMGDVGIRSSEQLSSIAQSLGISESQVLQSLGANLSNIDVGTGQAIGGMRETAGINAANIIQGTTGQQIGIEQGLAQQLAGLDQQTLTNIVNSIQSGAGTNLQSQQQLATLLAELGIGAGVSGQQTAIDLGTAQAGGVTNPIGNAINTGLGLYASGAFNQPLAPTPTTGGAPMNFNLSTIPQLPGVSGSQGVFTNPEFSLTG